MVKVILAVDDENKSYLMNNKLQIGVKSCSVVEHFPDDYVLQLPRLRTYV
jgi:hypothetical protein